MDLKLEKVGPRFSCLNAMPATISKTNIVVYSAPDENFIITLKEHFV